MSRPMPYQPMGTKALVPESRLQEILEKHKKVTDAKPQTGELPRRVEGLVGVGEAPRVLRWEKPKRGPNGETATGVRTSCGKWSCAKVTVNGQVFYELWRIAPGGNWFTCVKAQMTSFAQAQDLAEQTLREKP